jgi:hypothetical protein
MGEDRRFAVTFVGLEYATDGSTSGTYKVRSQVTLSDDSQEFSGPFKAEIFDLSGNVTFTLTGTVRAKRVLVEAL